jgi:hypothetical protein
MPQVFRSLVLLRLAVAFKADCYFEGPKRCMHHMNNFHTAAPDGNCVGFAWSRLEASTAQILTKEGSGFEFRLPLHILVTGSNHKKVVCSKQLLNLQWY